MVTWVSPLCLQFSLHWWHVGYGGPWGVSEFLLGVQSQGLVQFAGRLLGQVALGEASWR